MKNFKFSMQSILDVNMTLRDVAMSEVSIATQRLDHEYQELNRVVALMDKEMDQSRLPSADFASYILQREKFLKRLRDLKLNHERNIDAAKRMLDKAQNKLKTAFIEVRKMEKAAENQKEKWDYEFKREEQGKSDEMGTNRHFFPGA